MGVDGGIEYICHVYLFAEKLRKFNTKNMQPSTLFSNIRDGTIFFKEKKPTALSPGVTC